jgi:hypothetical protein
MGQQALKFFFQLDDIARKVRSRVPEAGDLPRLRDRRP